MNSCWTAAPDFNLRVLLMIAVCSPCHAAAVQAYACRGFEPLKTIDVHTEDNTGTLQAAELAVRAGVKAGGGAALPGMILNTSKKTTYTDAWSGEEHSVPAGRMECTMQVGLPSPLLVLAGAVQHAHSFLCSAWGGCV